MGEALHIELSWPAKELWPNGGNPHPMVLHRFKKAAKNEAGWATKIVRPFDYAPPEAPIPVHITAHPKPTGPHPDKDNTIASLKAHLDAIADVLGMNDRDFDAPTVSFADRCQRGKIIVRM
jgi:crossover junction endodeoxyribonuclease RusA